jgi:hypothetical protein
VARGRILLHGGRRNQVRCRVCAHLGQVVESPGSTPLQLSTPIIDEGGECVGVCLIS